jgi:UDP-N-acetylglucosamine 2-epimerase (non-hydrolysing)
MRVLSIFGTRPEAIKMAPLVARLGREPAIDSYVVSTGQHQAMLTQVLELFGIKPDRDLKVMQPNQTLNSLAARLIERIDVTLERFRPDRVLVHGDTTTAMATAMAAFHRRVPVGHVEAGLRTHDIRQPWPEEMNRRVVDVVSDLLFAPTERSRANLAGERLNGRIFVTGNTVIDALQETAARIGSDAALRLRLAEGLPKLDVRQRMLLVTGHRRESFGEGFEAICEALRTLARRDDIAIVYPVHLNPNVRDVVHARLGGLANVKLIEPLDYGRFVYLMSRAHVVLTDSGGIQEEAPALGKPVLVMRDVTERPEAVEAGTVQLVGTDTERIVAAVDRLYDSDERWRSFAHKANPFGDGRASERIVDALLGRAVAEFDPALAGAPEQARAISGQRP